MGVLAHCQCFLKKIVPFLKSVNTACGYLRLRSETHCCAWYWCSWHCMFSSIATACVPGSNRPPSRSPRSLWLQHSVWVWTGMQASVRGAYPRTEVHMWGIPGASTCSDCKRRHFLHIEWPVTGNHHHRTGNFHDYPTHAFKHWIQFALYCPFLCNRPFAAEVCFHKCLPVLSHFPGPQWDSAVNIILSLLHHCARRWFLPKNDIIHGSCTKHPSGCDLRSWDGTVVLLRPSVVACSWTRWTAAWKFQENQKTLSRTSCGRIRFMMTVRLYRHANDWNEKYDIVVLWSGHKASALLLEQLNCKYGGFYKALAAYLCK